MSMEARMASELCDTDHAWEKEGGMRDCIQSHIIRRHIVFSGWVQGVGFRYRARHAAEMYGVTGWVRNDPGGSVTMEIQGTEEQIDQVIIAIERGTYIRIEDIKVRSIPTVDGEHDFRVTGIGI